MNLARALSLASIVFGVLFYLQGVLGLLWPASDADDVGLVSTAAVFILFGAFGLMLKPKPVA